MRLRVYHYGNGVEADVEAGVEAGLEAGVEAGVCVAFFQFSKSFSKKPTAPLNSLVKVGSKSLKIYGVPSAEP